MPFPGDILQLHNLSDKPITLQWDGRKTTIPPKKVGFVSFEQAVHEFGHPASTSKEMKLTDPMGNWHMVATRQEEVKRICLRHRWNLGIPDPLQDATVTVPEFTLTDQDGNRIWTVAEDPSGEHILTVTNTNPLMEDKIAYLERQLQLLKGEFDLNAYPAVPANAPDVKVPGLPQNPHQDPDLLTDD